MFILLLTLLVSLMIKAIFLTRYSDLGASSRLRSLQYLPFFNANGFDVDVDVSPLFSNEYLLSKYAGKSTKKEIILSCFHRFRVLLSLKKYDVVLIEKEIFPLIPAIAEYFLYKFGIKYIVDYDDAIFHNYDLSSNIFVRTIMRDKIDHVMSYATCVIVGNEYLSARAKAAGAQWVELIPTVVDIMRYSPRIDFSSSRPVIGWIGSPSTQDYVVGIKDALVSICNTYHARLLLVGATEKMHTEFNDLDIEILPWSEANEAEFIRKMDIGIMPLPDGPWEKGKCGYKIIQYMASGVPVVASPVGVNVKIVTESKCGILAESLPEWEAALLQLIQSPDQRMTMGRAGRSAVENIYSLQVQAPALMQIFSSSISQSEN